MSVRPARPEDRARVVRTMQRAFADDPMMRWVFPDDDTFEAESTPFFEMMFDVRVDRGTIWCTDDVVAAACWEDPGDHPRGKDFGERLWQEGMQRLTPRASERFALVGAAVGPHELPAPRWYLALLGTHPDWQRQGLGRTLLAPALEAADRDGLFAGLITETPANVAFYRAVGFEVAAEPVPEGGPQLWVMHRPPR